MIIGSIEPLSKKFLLQAEWVSDGSISRISVIEKNELRLLGTILKQETLCNSKTKSS